MTEAIDFIGIGAARCGTSWIANILRSHPKICVSEPKEIRYFNRYVLPVSKAKGKVNSNCDRDLAWYLDRFRHAREGQLRGEYSPIYLYDEAAASAIKSCFPDVKLIACLRNPADRAYSHYWLHRGSSVLGNIAFERALQQEEAYVGMGLYAKQLKRYLARFDRDQLLVLIFEELIRNPAIEMRRLFEFLGVTLELELDFSRYGINQRAKVRSRALKRAAFSVSWLLVNARLSMVVDWFRKMGVHTLLTSINSAPLRYPPMAEATRLRLMEIFNEDIAELENLLERDLSQWRVLGA
ncbi:MAG: sulfotransferase domain-containing protein [Gammaproteobacteria bacterium]|nr:sulfotransferase domain-containing protein [Gammaproteobacteria bacterium]